MKTEFIRNNNVLVEVENGKEHSYRSINAAKRESHRLQKKNGGLGNGHVQIKHRR